MKKILFATVVALFYCATIFAQESKSLLITNRPVPTLSQKQINFGNIEAQGTITLRIEFLANGEIGKIFPVSGLPYGLTENAVEAAKKIKFEPEIKNNHPVSISKQIQYFFTPNEGWKNTPSKFDDSKTNEKAESIIKKAVEKLGGEKYLQVKSQIGRGRFSVMSDNAIISFQSFVDVIVFPDKERTEFKGTGAKNVQTNIGKGGWIFDGEAQTIKEQTAAQIENYKRGINVSLDNFLRGGWRNSADLTYVGKRQASVGKRNDVVKLTYTDGFAVEFEFADDGTPVKSVYKTMNAAGEEVKEEDRYAQFIDVQGIRTPFIIDRFTNNVQVSRINYESIEFNRSIPDAIFVMPKNAKELKKDLKL